MCENPILIYNPVAIRIFHCKSAVYKDNQLLSLPSNITFPTYAALCGVYENGRKITNPEKIYNLARSCYIIVNGIRVNCFVSAQCGRCKSCLNAKRKEYRSRLLFESADCQEAYFFTLTYAPEYLPKEGLKRSDVSAYLKRLRINLQRAYMKHFNVSIEEAVEQTSFRCFYCGEYGSKTKRAHYHGMLFFKHRMTDDWDFYRKFCKLAYSSWGKCIEKAFNFSRCNSILKSAMYTSKYITKQIVECTPEGKTPCFVQGPSRNGGLGCLNAENYREIIIRSKSFVIMLKVDGKLVRTKVPNNLISKLFPQFGRVYHNVNDLFYIMDICYSELTARYDRDPLDIAFFDDAMIIDIRGSYAKVLVDRGYLRLGSTKQRSDNWDWVSCKKQIALMDTEGLIETFCDCMKQLYMLPSLDEYVDKFLDKQKWLQTVIMPDESYQESIEKATSEYGNHLRDVSKMITRHREY